MTPASRVDDGHAEFTGSHSVLVTGGEEELAITATTINQYRFDPRHP